MTKAPNRLIFLLHHLGVVGVGGPRFPVRACKGIGASSALLLALVVCAFAATPAFAGKRYIAGASFGAQGSGPGQLEDPEGIAVDNDASSPSLGDVYVADTGNRRIDEFTSSGTFVMAFGKNVGGLGEDTCTVTCLAGESGSEPGAFTNPQYIAVDQTTGDLYVGDTGDNLVTKFSESGAYQAQLTGTCENTGETPPSCSDFTPFKELQGVAVGSAGELVVLQGSEESGFSVAEFSGTGVFDETFSTGAFIPALAVDSHGAIYVSGNQAEKYESGLLVSQFSQFPSAYAINPTTNNLLVFQSKREAQYTNDIQLYPPFAEPSAPIETFAAEGLSPSHGIAVSGAEAAGYPLYATQPATDTVATFDYAQLPLVHSEPASSVEITQQAGHPSVLATLNGTVDPNELPVTKCVFEYGTSTAYGHTVPCEQSLEAISKGKDGKGDETVPVTAKLTNLLPSTTYHFRIRAANQNDEREQPNPGTDEEFPTPGPAIVSEVPASGTSGTQTTLSGEVNPGGLPLSRCEFEYGTKAELTASGLYEHSAPCEPGAAAIGAGTAPVPVHAALTNLVGGTAYSFRLVATTEVFATKEQVTVAGAGQEFSTLTTPVVAGGEAVNVTASGAELRATVNPEGLQVSHCAFEYGTSTAYEESEPCSPSLKEIGHGSQFVAVSAQIGELQPNTIYHWRLSVRDKNGEASVVDHTFLYPTTTTAELPDHRSYEMVTPPFKNGALVGDVFGGFKYSNSEDGSRVMASSIQCFASALSCTATRSNQGEPFEFTRTDEGWVTAPLAPPQQLRENTAYENTAWGASADAGTALFSAPTGPGGEDEWWARAADGTFAALGPASPPGTSGFLSFHNGIRYSTADLSHLVWEFGETDLETFWPFDKTTENRSLYEYAGTHNKEPFLVAVSGETSKHELISTCGTQLGSRTAGGHGALSADGRTVYFTALPREEGNGQIVPCSGSGGNEHLPVPVQELYARVDGESTAGAGQSAAARTAAISEPRAPQAPGSGGPHPECESEACKRNTASPVPPATNPSWRDAEFDGASNDGSRVFFASEQQLTDGAAENSMNLYESECAGCEGLSEAEELAKRRLIDVSEGVGGAPVRGGPRVQGFPVAISADGSHVYFVAQGVLTGVPNSQGLTPRDGADNLYVYESDARYPQGHLAFIASLSAANCRSGGDCKQWLDYPRANVTPDGRFLVFTSFAALTPDDTRSGEAQQIFRYDAETGELVRISVGNDGYNDDGNAGTGNAAIVAAYSGDENLGLPREDPTMSNDGSYVFFMSPIGLTPHALNGVVIGEEKPSGSAVLLPLYAQNVYEWELAGTPGGSCPAGAPGGGCVYLISDGHDVSEAVSVCGAEERTHGAASCLLGSDASGHNVFFETADQLVPKDTDTQVDIYDARICEPANGNPCITEPLPALPPCGGEQCHGIPEPTPSLLAPGTATFNGEGNTTPAVSPPPKKVTKKTTGCKRGFVKKKIKKKEQCVKVKSKKRAKKSSKSKRGGKS